MGADAPQWLFSSFVDAMQEIGASAPIPLLEAEMPRDESFTIPAISSRLWRVSMRLPQQHTILMFCGLLCGIKERFSTAVSMFSNAALTAMNKNSPRCITRVLAWRHWA